MKNNKQKDWLNWEIGVCAAGTAPYQEIGTDRIYFGEMVGGTPLSYRLYPNGGPMFDPIHKCEYCGSKFASDFILHVCPQCGAPY